MHNLESGFFNFFFLFGFVSPPSIQTQVMGVASAYTHQELDHNLLL